MALIWLLINLLVACATRIPDTKQANGVVRVDKIAYVGVPAPPGATFINVAFVMDVSKFRPKVLIRRDALPTPSVFDDKIDMKEYGGGIMMSIDSVEVGTYYFGFWGGELLYSYQYFAGPEDNVGYALLAATSRCSNEQTYGTHCDSRAHSIPLSDENSPVWVNTTTNYDDSDYVARLHVSHDTERLEVQTDIVIDLPEQNDTIEVEVAVALHYDVTRTADDIWREEFTSVVLPENGTTTIARSAQLNVPYPRVGLWTLRVTASARLISGSSSDSSLAGEVDTSRWCFDRLQRGVDFRCSSQTYPGICEDVAWSLSTHGRSCSTKYVAAAPNTLDGLTASISALATAYFCLHGNTGQQEEVEVEYAVFTVTEFANGTTVEDVEHSTVNETCKYLQYGSRLYKKGGRELSASYVSSVATLSTQRSVILPETIDERNDAHNRTTFTQQTINTAWPYVIFQASLRDAPIGANMRVKVFMDTQGYDPTQVVVKMRCGALPGSNISSAVGDEFLFDMEEYGSTSFDKQTGVQVSKLTVVRPVIQQRYDLQGRCYFLVAPTSSPEEAGWNVLVQLQLQFDECASSCVHGRCVITRGDVVAAMCECRYPYGGEDCSERAISQAQYELHVSLLVVTNAAMLPGVFAASCRQQNGIAAVLLASSIASMFYHLCDVDAYCFAGMSFRTLQIMDMYGAFYAMLLIVLYFANLPAEKMWASAMVISPVLMLFVIESIDTAVFVTVAIVCGAFVALGHWAYLWHLASAYELVTVKDRTQEDETSRTSTTALTPQARPYWHRLWRTVVNFFVHGQNFCYWRVFLGLAFVVGAFVCFGTMTRTNYWYVHSMWHVFVMGSTYFFITGRTKGPYQVFTGFSVLVDTVAPVETTEAQPIQHLALTHAERKS